MKLFLRSLAVLFLMSAAAGPAVIAQDLPKSSIDSIFKKSGGGEGEDRMYCRFGNTICECYLNSWGQPQCLGIAKSPQNKKQPKNLFGSL